MSYETALAVFIIFSIPAFILVVFRLFMIKRRHEAEQANLDLVFSSYKDDSRGITH